MNVGETLKELWNTSGFANFTWQNVVMLLIAFVLLFLAIKKKFEPLLLVGIAFGILLTNLPVGNVSDSIFHADWWNGLLKSQWMQKDILTTVISFKMVVY